jgi:hypothetical protein
MNRQPGGQGIVTPNANGDPRVARIRSGESAREEMVVSKARGKVQASSLSVSNLVYQHAVYISTFDSTNKGGNFVSSNAVSEPPLPSCKCISL